MGVPRPLYPRPAPHTYRHFEKQKQAEGGLAHGIGTLASCDPGHIINPSGPPVHTSLGCCKELLVCIGDYLLCEHFTCITPFNPHRMTEVG